MKLGTVYPLASKMKNIPSVSNPPIAKVIDPQMAGPVHQRSTKKKLRLSKIAADAPTSNTYHP